jgi:putative transposase
LLPDVVREMFRTFEQQMMDAEVENACGVGYGDVSPRRGEPFRSAGDAAA